MIKFISVMNRMKPRIFILLLLTAVIIWRPEKVCADSDLMPYDELKSLNEAIDDVNVYRSRHMKKIDSLKRLARQSKDSDDKWEKLLSIASLYRLMNADSAVYYAEKACNIAQKNMDSRQEIMSRLVLINSLSTAGIFTVAKTNYESIDIRQIPSDLKTEYWKTGGMLYTYIMSQMGDNNVYADEAQKIYKTISDSLIRNLDKTDPVFKRMQIDRMIDEGRYADAREIGETLLSQLKEEDRQYGLTALQLAVVCDFQGDQKNFASYLAKSATSDVKACVTEGMALPALANWLYENDGLDDAYKYVNFALQDASSNSARMRTFAIAQLVPYVDEAYRKKIDASNRKLWAGFIAVAVLLSATIVLVVILVRQNKRTHQAKEHLDKISRIQESYVGNFISLWSSYAARLDSVTKLVGRKLSSGQADELLKMVKAGKLDASQDDEDFNKLFDNAFLDMYPNFVTNVNSLLRPDQQIDVKEEGGLSPELRIYAFVKLGVDESVKIAQIMRYSVSTVYAYRNRMRNRAIDREGFDLAVTAVGR